MQRLVYRIGYRGASLLTFAFIDFVIAYSLVSAKSLPVTEAYRVINIVPFTVWAFAWFLAGLVCFVQAFARRNDAIGFGFASGITFIWSFGFAAAFVFYDAYRAWVAAATWLVIALFVLLISGWKEPRHYGGNSNGRAT